MLTRIIFTEKHFQKLLDHAMDRASPKAIIYYTKKLNELRVNRLHDAYYVGNNNV